MRIYNVLNHISLNNTGFNWTGCDSHILPLRPNSPLKNWPANIESPSDCNILNTTPEFHYLKLLEIPITTVLFVIKPWLTHSLIHSLTHSLTHSPTHPPNHPPTHSLTHSLTYSLITVAYPKQKIDVFIDFCNFNFVDFSLLIWDYRCSLSRGVPMIKYSLICSKFPGEH